MMALGNEIPQKKIITPCVNRFPLVTCNVDYYMKRGQFHAPICPVL
jgi:hypothetical protein